MADKPAEQSATPWHTRLRRAVLFVLFALVLLIPRLLSLRKQRRTWNLVRAGVAVTGLVLVLAAWDGVFLWLWAVAGGFLILLAACVPASKAVKTVDQQARELGALVVVHGGALRQAGRKPIRANLYVAPEHWYALDLKHRPLLEIPRSAVESICVDEEADGWTLRVRWNESDAEFHYGGFFGEHLARVAETTLRSQWRPHLPVLK